MKKSILFFVFYYLYCAAISAQTGSEIQNEVISPKSYFKTSLSYLSNNVYQGRKDSSVISYITPSISYLDKSGFNITGSLSYSPNPAINEIELVSLEAGYDHQFSQSLSFNAYGAAYFYNKFSSSVQAENNAGFGAGINYSPKDIFILSADAGLSVAKKPDIATEASLGHPFYFGSDGHDWSVVPAAAIIAGSQNYYQSYYTDRKFNQAIRTRQLRRRRANTSTTNTASTVTVLSSEGFKVLDYELSVPVTYDEKKWGLFFTPTYAIPIHPFSYIEDGSTTPIVESLTNSFYVSIGAYLKL